jgi:tight adherence protein B
MTRGVARPVTRTCWLLAVLMAVMAAGVATGASANAATSAAKRPPRAVMILVDIHLSITRAIAAEHAAVLSYARALPAEVRAGLITFSDRWQLVLRPTTNRAHLAHALAAIRPVGVTSNGIYPAIEAAEAAVGRLHASPRSRLIVFSDAEAITGGVPSSSLPTDVVTWRLDRDDRLPLLRAFARASHGRVVSPARAAVLVTAFPPLTPPASHRKASGPGRSAPSGPAAHARAGRSTSWLLVGGLAVVFAAVFVVALLVTGSLLKNEQGRNLTERIGRYGPQRTSAPPEGEGKLARTALGWTAGLLRSSNTERGLAARLDLAGITRSPAEWALLGVCLAALLAIVLTVVSRNVLLGIPGGALIGWLAMRLVLSIRIGRRRAAFSEQLPDVLQLIAGSLQSGFSLPQALDGVVREDTQPTSGEFSRALAEARIGADLEDALDGVANRMDSEDLRWTVMAIRIQRGVGGNLAEVLRNTVDTMRERAFLRRQVRALSAEGRLSAYILSVLPVAVGGWLTFMDPKYMRPLYTTPVGLIMLAVTAVLYAVGVFWMRNVIKVVV